MLRVGGSLNRQWETSAEQFFTNFTHLKKMNFLDLIIAIPLGYLIFKGYRRGLIFELAALVGIIIGSKLAVQGAGWLTQLIGLEGPNALLIAFFILFVAAVALAMLLAKLIERFIKLLHIGFLNNLAGAVLGLVKGVCIVGVLVYFIAIVDVHEKVLTSNTKENSMLYRPVMRTGMKLVGKMEVYINSRKAELDK